MSSQARRSRSHSSRDRPQDGDTRPHICVTWAAWVPWAFWEEAEAACAPGDHPWTLRDLAVHPWVRRDLCAHRDLCPHRDHPFYRDRAYSFPLSYKDALIITHFSSK